MPAPEYVVRSWAQSVTGNQVATVVDMRGRIHRVLVAKRAAWAGQADLVIRAALALGRRAPRP